MASMYLLGNPDHYTNFKFVPVYWQSFVREVTTSSEQTHSQTVVPDGVPGPGEHAKSNDVCPDVLNGGNLKTQKSSITAPEHEIEDYPEKVTIFDRSLGFRPFMIMCNAQQSFNLCVYTTGIPLANVKGYF
jgi:hypothetical protein